MGTRRRRRDWAADGCGTAVIVSYPGVTLHPSDETRPLDSGAGGALMIRPPACQTPSRRLIGCRYSEEESSIAALPSQSQFGSSGQAPNFVLSEELVYSSLLCFQITRSTWFDLLNGNLSAFRRSNKQPPPFVSLQFRFKFSPMSSYTYSSYRNAQPPFRFCRR